MNVERCFSMQMYKKVAYKCMTSHLRCTRNAAPFCSQCRFGAKCLHSALFACTALIINALQSVGIPALCLHTYTLPALHTYTLYYTLTLCTTQKPINSPLVVLPTGVKQGNHGRPVTGERIFSRSNRHAYLPMQTTPTVISERAP